MNTNEAFDATLAAVEELRQSGISVEVKPSRSRSDSELVKKYSGPERVAPDRWVNVSFHPKTPEQSKAIAEKAKHIGWLGIGFDTGGCAGQRDWELDWSFRYTGMPDGELEVRRDHVEQLITEVIEKDGNIPKEWQP